MFHIFFFYIVTFSDEILVQVRASERNKRSASGKFHPDRYDLKLAPSGKEVHLALQRNDRLNTHVPTLSLKDQLMKNENFEETEVIMNTTYQFGNER